MIRIRGRALARIAIATAFAAAVLAPSAHAACGDQSFSTPFAPWGDLGFYAPVANGDFELGTAEGWTLSGKADVVKENSRHHVGGGDDQYSLELGPGSSATTPPICVGSGYPAARMFGRTVVPSKDSGSTLQLDVLYTDATRGSAAVKKLGTVPTLEQWDPTRKLSLAQGQLNVKPDSGGRTYIRFRFTPLYRTTWRIDDVYVDPRMRN